MVTRWEWEYDHWIDDEDDEIIEDRDKEKYFEEE